jgi:hypothetical protein
MKHAGPGASAAVRLQFTPAEVHVDVEDDGAGRSAEPGAAGGGLTGMRERISAFGGELDFGPRHPRGWRVTARMPGRDGIEATRDIAAGDAVLAPGATRRLIRQIRHAAARATQRSARRADTPRPHRPRTRRLLLHRRGQVQ